MRPFMSRKRGRIFAEFTDVEARLMVSLCSQLISLYEDRHATDTSEQDPLMAMMGSNQPVSEPEDPVLQRLLPNAYRDEPEDAAEFRRLTERQLTVNKSQNARSIIETFIAAGLDLAADSGPDLEVEMDADAALSWLRALTDLRIAVAVRLGIETDDDAEIISQSRDSQTLAMYDIYEWLGYVQETLVAAMP